MKKFLVIIAVLALTVISSVAMAEVTVSGSVDIRSLMWNNNTDFTDKLGDRDMTTQERIRLNIDAKNDNVKGRITLENDWERWGTETPVQTTGMNANISGANGGINPGANGTGVEARQGEASQRGSTAKSLGFREAWIDFTIPGAQPAHVKVGHQFLQLGNGWFFRSMKYGSDAWLVGLPGKNTVAFVDVKVKEGLTTQNDDVDAYVLLDNFKIDDTKTVGVYWARVQDRRNYVGQAFGLGGPGTDNTLDNIGLWFNGKLGPVNLQAELDFQMGKASGAPGQADDKYKGQQIVVQANMPVNPFSVNAAIAQGSGQKYTGLAQTEMKMFVPVLDSDPHYTIVYEYFAPTACTPDGDMTHAQFNSGFCNTTALNIGGSMDVAKWMNVSLDFWKLKATEKVRNRQTQMTDDIGNEIDVVLKFKLYDQLTWNWQIARLMPGKAYDTTAGGKNVSADPIDAIQGVLSYKF